MTKFYLYQMSNHSHTEGEECSTCHEHLVEYKCCPKCGGETARITHVSYDDIFFLKRGKWDLGKEKVSGKYSHRYQCMNEQCGWTSW